MRNDRRVVAHHALDVRDGWRDADDGADPDEVGHGVEGHLDLLLQLEAGGVGLRERSDHLERVDVVEHDERRAPEPAERNSPTTTVDAGDLAGDQAAEDGLVPRPLSAVHFGLHLGDDRRLFVDGVRTLGPDDLGLVLRGPQVAPRVRVGVVDASLLLRLGQRGLAGVDLTLGRMHLGIQLVRPRTPGG